MAAFSHELWATVREQYERSELTVREIAALAGVSVAAIYQHAKREGWASKRRRGVFRRPSQAAPAALVAMSGESGGAEDVDRAEVARRLWGALDLHLKELETAEPPAGMVRQAQNLATLARTLGTLVDVERDIAAANGKAGDDDGEALDRDSLLQEIMRRVETME